jgi:hypothetical protein
VDPSSAVRVEGDVKMDPPVSGTSGYSVQKAIVVRVESSNSLTSGSTTETVETVESPKKMVI